MTEPTIIIVGGGASGLSAAGALARRGLAAVVLEQDREIGGTWARRYDRLHLQTVSRFSGLAHFPIPRRYPTYLSRTDFVAYLNEYARHFNLRVVTGASVRTIRPLDGGSRGWNIETKSGVFADGTSEPFDAIIAATGFTTGLESILDAPGVLDDDGEPLGSSGEPTPRPGLYFIGFTHTLRGHLFEANRASRRLARNVEHYLTEHS